MPENAVEGGFDEDGPLYVSRSDSVNVNDPSHFLARKIGYYSPKRKRCEHYLYYGRDEETGVITLKEHHFFQVRSC